MKSERIPHYADPSTITSKYSKSAARIADFVWWLFKHRNAVVGIGLEYTDGSLGGTTILKAPNGWDKPLLTLNELLNTCKELVSRPNLKTVYVNGGNGEDRPGIPVYSVDVIAD